jgi:serine/threonine protein kinase
MLFEMLTGRPPYVASTPTKQIMMHILQPVPDVLQANPDLPFPAQPIIKKAMAKDREERYQTAAELALAVRQLATAPSATTESDSLVLPASPFATQPSTVDDRPAEAVQAEADAKALPNTLLEELDLAVIPDSAVEGKMPDSIPAPSAEKRAGPGERVRIPAWGLVDRGL